MSTPPPNFRADWAPFATEVKRLREERGLQKQQLAALIGAAPSWISGVEKATIAPSQRRVEGLALALGVPIASLPVPADRQVESVDSPDSGNPDALLPLIWRARCDLLRGLAQTTPAKQPERRRRLQQLATYLDRAAAEHPSAAAFSANRSLWPLHALAEQSPAWTRAVALAEVACMKIDAPFETGAHRDAKRLTHLDFIALDLGLGAEVGERVAHTVLEAHAKLSLPLWQELTPIGGSRGLLALRSLGADTVGLEVLVGADPVGWLGAPYAAGRWLLEGAHDGGGAASTPVTGVDQAWGSAAVVVGAVPATAMMIGAVLGPIVGAAAAGLLTGAALARAASRTPLKVDEVLARQEADTTQARRTALVAESFGRHWVSVEATKLLALYEALRLVDVLVESPLPPATDAADTCQRVAGAVGLSLVDEESASGTTSGSVNERIKELRQIKATLEWTAAALRARNDPVQKAGATKRLRKPRAR